MKIDKTAIENYNKGCNLLENKKYNEAVTAFSVAIAYQFNYVDAYKKRAVARKLSGDLKGALEDYNAIMLFEPEDIIAYNNIGNIYYKLGDYGNAVESYLKAISINENFDLAIKNLHNTEKYLSKNYYLEKGISFFKDEKDYNKAILYFNRVIELNKNCSKAYEYRGRSYYALKSIKPEQAIYYSDIAINDLETAYKIEPDSEEITNFFYMFTVERQSLNFSKHMSILAKMLENSSLEPVEYAKVMGFAKSTLMVIEEGINNITYQDILDIQKPILEESYNLYNQLLKDAKKDEKWQLNILFKRYQEHKEDDILRFIAIPLYSCMKETCSKLSKNIDNIELQNIQLYMQELEHYKRIYEYIEPDLQSKSEFFDLLDLLKPKVEVIKSIFSNNIIMQTLNKYGNVNKNNFAPIKESSKKRKVDL